MFVSKSYEVTATLAALNRSHAVIEFKMDGTIISANENFLAVLGYRLADIRGRPHALFVAAKDRHSTAYRRFWDALSRGEFQAGEYLLIAKHGRDVWMQATYSPILKRNGKPFKIIAFGNDITARRKREGGGDGQGAPSRLSPEMVALQADVGRRATARKRPAAAAGADPMAASTGADKIRGQELPVSETGPEASEPTSRIVDVVDMINRIAAENNLAALRAAIEAGRAGEAMIGDPRSRSQLRRSGRTA
jgi:methyl-accepting chemotaxis protein